MPSSSEAAGPRPAAAGDSALAKNAEKFNSLNMSCAVSVSFAPCRISSWQPRLKGLWMEPGIANTSRPQEAASRAVIR